VVVVVVEVEVVEVEVVAVAVVEVLAAEVVVEVLAAEFVVVSEAPEAAVVEIEAAKTVVAVDVVALKLELDSLFEDSAAEDELDFDVTCSFEAKVEVESTAADSLAPLFDAEEAESKFDALAEVSDVSDELIVVCVSSTPPEST